MEKVWNGGSGDWDVGSNWTPEGTPGPEDTATINPPPPPVGDPLLNNPYDTIIATDIDVGTLTLNPGGEVLDVNGTLHASNAVYQAGNLVNFAQDTTLDGFTYYAGEELKVANSALVRSDGALTLGTGLHLVVGGFQPPGPANSLGIAGSASLQSRTVLTNDGLITARSTIKGSEIEFLSPTFINNGGIKTSGAAGVFWASRTADNNGLISLRGSGYNSFQMSSLTQGEAGSTVVGPGSTLRWETQGAADVTGGTFRLQHGSTMTLADRYRSVTSVTVEDSVRFANNGDIKLGSFSSLRVGDLHGSGTVSLGNNATLEVGTASNVQTITFAGNSGTLTVDTDAHGCGYALDATISGFDSGGLQNPDSIDLKTVAANGAQWSDGTLQLTEDNVGVAKLHLAGNFEGASFLVTSDGSGGSLVSLASLPTTSSEALSAVAAARPSIGADFPVPGSGRINPTPSDAQQESASSVLLQNLFAPVAIPILPSQIIG